MQRANVMMVDSRKGENMRFCRENVSHRSCDRKIRRKKWRGCENVVPRSEREAGHESEASHGIEIDVKVRIQPRR